MKNPFSWLYYRYIFLRESALMRGIASLVGSPSVPSKQAWESGYRNGQWERLNGLSEQAHNAVVLAYISYLRPDCSILEIGCGEGGLLKRLRQIGYRSYTGIDLSEVAISRCQPLADHKTVFLSGDAEAYVPSTTFDVMVLNECIYYFEQPVASLQRYAKYLAPNGVIVISLFDKDRTRPIRRRLMDTFSLTDETVVSNSKGTWYCMVLAPRESKTLSGDEGHAPAVMAQVESGSGERSRS